MTKQTLFNVTNPDKKVYPLWAIDSNAAKQRAVVLDGYKWSNIDYKAVKSK
jgi:hypothetical protein